MPKVQITGESARDALNRIGEVSELVNDGYRCGIVTPERIRAAALDIGQTYAQHREGILLLMNANTMPAGLQRQAILQEMVREFALAILPAQAFSTVFANVPLEGTDKIDVPYYPLQTAASTDYNPANGYVTGNTVTSVKEITVNKRKYQGASFTSAELARQPFLKKLQLMKINAQRLGYDVFQDILSVVTQANFGDPILQSPANAFDSDDVIDIRGACNTANWPQAPRSLIVDSAYDANLCKDSAMKHALNLGSDVVLRTGQVPAISGFSYYQCPNIPANGQNLKGMAVYPSGLLIGVSPIMPAPAVMRQMVSYEVVVLPELGIAFEYRNFGDAQMDSESEIVECNYGYLAGEAAAIKRITA